MKGILHLLALAALLSTSGLSLAATPSPHHDALAKDILANLEINTFHNSLRPRHYPDGMTLGETPFRILEKIEGERASWGVVDEERSWIYMVRIIKSGPEGVTICFVDDSFVGTYLASSPLLLKKSPNGHYRVVKELGDLPSCSQTNG